MPWVEGEDRPTDTGSAAQGCVRLSGGGRGGREIRQRFDGTFRLGS